MQVVIKLPMESIQRKDKDEILRLCLSSLEGYSPKQQEKARKKFSNYLHAHGMKYTYERLEVLKVIFLSNKIFSGKSICDKLKETKVISNRTVYNTIKLLLKAGVIKKINKQEVLFNESLMELVV